MRNTLIKNENIEIRRSDKNGYGVFAKEDIKEGTILEECRLLFLPPEIRIESIDRYIFPWDPDDPMKAYALPTGFGCLYNSSNGSAESVRTVVDEDDHICVYIANQNIEKDEELTMDYKFYDDSLYYTSIVPNNQPGGPDA